MIAVLLSLLASTAWGTSDFIGGRASRDRSVFAVFAITRPVGLVFLGILVVIIRPPWVGAGWISAAVAGFVLFGGMLCLYRSLAIGPMSVIAPIFATGSVVPVLWGVVRGETPGVVVLAGLAVAIVGTILAARAPGTGGERSDPRGVAYAVGAALGLGAGLALLDAAADHAALTAVLVERAVETSLILAVLVANRRVLVPQLRGVGIIPLAGVLDVSAQMLFALASRSGLLPVVSVLSSLYPVVTVLLARAVLDERLSRTQAVGAGLTLLGVAVVAVGG